MLETAAREHSLSKTREELLKPQTKATEERITIVSKFSTKSATFKKIIKKHWTILQMEPDFWNLFTHEPRFAYTRGKNLGEMIKKKIDQKKKMTYRGTIPCYNCNSCNNVIKGSHITHPMRGNKIQLRVNATCDTTNAIYMLKCPCGKVYVGQTECKMKVRLNEHKSNIRTRYNKSTVAMHFEEAGHNASQLKFCVLETIEKQENMDNRRSLLRRENYWIFHLNSMKPLGLNDRVEFLCYL